MGRRSRLEKADTQERADYRRCAALRAAASESEANGVDRRLGPLGKSALTCDTKFLQS